MDVNDTVVITKTGIYTISPLLSSMVIFNDLGYILIAMIGGLASMINEHFEYLRCVKDRKGRGEEPDISAFQALVGALGIGFLFTLGSFILFNSAGEHIIAWATKSYVNIELLIKVAPSFWMVLTIWLSTKAVTFYKWFSRSVDKRSQQ